jgi:hypothetical protein
MTKKKDSPAPVPPKQDDAKALVETGWIDEGFDDGHDEMMDALEVHFHMLTCPDHTQEERRAAAFQALAAFKRYASGDDGIEGDERINAPTSYAVN